MAAGRVAGAPQGVGADLTEVVREWWSAAWPAPAAQQMLGAAIEQFGERGFHATTTRDIVTRVGMSTGAMYAYFASKERLLFEVVHTGHRRAVDALRDAIASTDDPVQQLPAVIHTFTVWHATNHNIARIVHNELYSLSEKNLAPVFELRRATQRLMTDVLERGVAAERFAVDDIPGTARALLSLCIDVARWYRPECPSTPAELGDLYAGLAARMVAAT